MSRITNNAVCSLQMKFWQSWLLSNKLFPLISDFCLKLKGAWFFEEEKLTLRWSCSFVYIKEPPSTLTSTSSELKKSEVTFLLFWNNWSIPSSSVSQFAMIVVFDVAGLCFLSSSLATSVGLIYFTYSATTSCESQLCFDLYFKKCFGVTCTLGSLYLIQLNSLFSIP